MYYLFTGTDRIKILSKRNEILEALLRKRPAAEIIRVLPESWSQEVWKSMFSCQGLFERKFIVLADDLGSKAESRDGVLDRLKDIAESDNAFLLVESAPPESYMKTLAKRAEGTFSFEMKKGSTGQKFNVFSLGDALGQRNKKNLWVLFREALSVGIPVEQIHGTIFWQVKNIALASECKNAHDAGMKEYPFMKARSYSRNFSNEELNKLVFSLNSIYHDARAGGADIEIGLEKFILEL